MLERWETYDTRGAVTGYLLKEAVPGRSSSTRTRPWTRRSGNTDALVVDRVCQIVGFIMLTALVVLFWLLMMYT
jgi:hypothetical protein